MFKRIIDLLLSILLTILLSIPVILILIVAWIIIKDFPLLSQNRKLVINSKSIKIHKIKTIVKSEKFILEENSNKKVFIKPEYEKYVPAFCRWLRKSGVDEIPQLFNVIKGEMSLVGPRPMIEKDLLQIKSTEPELYKLREKLKSKPGITGYWQLFGERKKGFKNLIELDLYYEKNKSFLMDFKIIIKTFFVMLGAKHSDSIVSKRVKKKLKELSLEKI